MLKYVARIVLGCNFLHIMKSQAAAVVFVNSCSCRSETKWPQLGEEMGSESPASLEEFSGLWVYSVIFPECKKAQQMQI